MLDSHGSSNLPLVVPTTRVGTWCQGPLVQLCRGQRVAREGRSSGEV